MIFKKVQFQTLVNSIGISFKIDDYENENQPPQTFDVTRIVEPPANSMQYDRNSSITPSEFSITNRQAVSSEFIPAFLTTDKFQDSIDEEYQFPPARKIPWIWSNEI